jgi:hypothetical protein
MASKTRVKSKTRTKVKSKVLTRRVSPTKSHPLIPKEIINNIKRLHKYLILLIM